MIRSLSVKISKISARGSCKHQTRPETAEFRGSPAFRRLLPIVFTGSFVKELRVVPGVLGLALLSFLAAPGMAAGGLEASPVNGPGVGQVLSEVPEVLDPAARYLFYLHGRIIEDGGERPTHPVFGVYEYRWILEVLAEAGFVVVSERRPPGTDPDDYAGEILRQVEALLTGGVPPASISVVGFSKGAAIAQRVSARLGNPDVNFVFLGSCSPASLPAELKVVGRILAIYEETDELSGPCTRLFARSPELEETCEIRISTGQRHGAFYEPREEWLRPVLDWCRGVGAPAAGAPPSEPRRAETGS